MLKLFLYSYINMLVITISLRYIYVSMYSFFNYLIYFDPRETKFKQYFNIYISIVMQFSHLYHKMIKL